jgi:DNA-binding NarL/FixJ family response regulator
MPITPRLTQAERQEKIDRAIEMKCKGYSNVDIAKRLGLNESTVRRMLKESNRLDGAS